ncbi:hypothetical protein K0M31_003465 [Melipona bicolor]|uniref:Odorant receptor n=1 Tax=Melipona bicolor TaxID=60889 RepID=A0AA40FYY7_9HYME|nr:hypothetical protein K0M31_003465 [Melipona bicolor]
MDDVTLFDEKYNNMLMHEAYVKVCRSIEGHKRAVEYVDKIDACYVRYFFLLLGLIIVAFTSTFVRLSTMEVGIRFFTFCGFTIAQLVHLLFLTVMGQFVENSNDEIFQTVYEGKWYNGSSKTQLLYILVLRKCLTPPTLTGGGLVSLNLYSFVQVSRVIVFYSTETLMDEVVYLVISITILIKQYNYILNEKKFDELLSEIVFDRLMERPREELEILDTYYRKAIIFSSIYKASISTSALTFILIPAIPPILNIIAPLNQSRGREFVYPAYFFVDEQRYYYPILANMIMGALVLAAVYIASDINLIYLIHHGCALLAISGYRFKHALDDVYLYDEKYNDAIMHEAYAKVCRSIEGHKRAVEYVEKIDACYVHYFLILLGIIIVAFTSTFIRVGQCVNKNLIAQILLLLLAEP